MSDLISLSARLQALEPILDLPAKQEEFLRLKAASEDSSLWNDQEGAVKVLSELSAVKAVLEKVEELKGFLEMGESLSENDLLDIEKEIKILEQQALLSGEYDKNSAILTIHAGTGGVDAQDFAEMLQRMFLRFAEQGKTEQSEDRVLSLSRTNWKADVVDLTRGEEAGVKKAVLEIQGTNAYGLLKSEAGVHRLVRLSPFNSKNLRQTSFALVEVVPEVEQAHGITIDEQELRIDVFRAGGHGGQGVNTTDSAVRITHLPSGIVVSVQNERSQHQNKATAMKILQSKLLRLQELKNAEEAAMLKGEFKEGSWGNQIRSYVMQPYQMVKDHRTNAETSDVNGVFDGDLKLFIEAFLKNPAS
jgi:peptide chain release factor 2